MFGQSGHGLFSMRVSGGRESSSSWCTDAAPWRCAVPRQSAPVSPPPMITTCLPFAVMKSASAIVSPSFRRFCSVRYSIAKWMPISSRPGTGKSRGRVEPPASTTASNCTFSSSTGMSTPTFTRVLNSMPSSVSSCRRRSRNRFSSLNSGMP